MKTTTFKKLFTCLLLAVSPALVLGCAAGSEPDEASAGDETTAQTSDAIWMSCDMKWAACCGPCDAYPSDWVHTKSSCFNRCDTVFVKCIGDE